MKFFPCFGFLLLFFYNVSCSVYSEVADENLPFSYQPSGWKRVFEKMLEKKRSLPFPFFSNKNDLSEFALCAICDVAMSVILTERGFDMTKVQIEAQLQYFCSSFLGIEDDRVCEGIIDVNADAVLYIMDNTKDMVGSTQICSQLLDCDVGSEYFEWTIGDLKGKTVDKVESTGEKTFKIAHITDIHYDPNYTEGKVLKCGEPLCCQPDQPDATADQTACGRWSSFKDADSPLRLLNAAIDGINEQDYDYVYFTGDLVAHTVWKTSQEYNKKTITEAMDLFAKKFKKPVIPILGNHETHPVNLYAPLNITDDSINQKWLFETVFDKWSKWLDEEAKETIKQGGFYSILLKKGFRVIVLNNNAAHKENWWNLYDSEDPYGQLKWLVQTLEKAENNKEIVHILSHIPSSSCMKVWSREYNKIIERFSNTIAAQFNGHTHKDHFSIYYDSKNVANNMVINGASVMPDKANPNFKIYTVDSTGYDIMDAEVYSFDLEKANNDKIETIKWEKLYSFANEFGVSKLVPSELDALIKRMADGIKKKDYTLIDLYHKFYYRNSKSSQAKCDETCQKKYICEILTTVHGETSMCDNLWT